MDPGRSIFVSISRSRRRAAIVSPRDDPATPPSVVLPIELSLLIDSVDRPMINRSVDLSEEYYLGGMLESIEISLINILFRSYY